MSTFYIKQNDRKPDIYATLGWPDETAISLTGISSVDFKIRPTGSTSGVVTMTATVVSAANGTVTASWSAGSTATVGTYDAEWQITWSSGITQTVPNYQYATVVISDDLD